MDQPNQDLEVHALVMAAEPHVKLVMVRMCAACSGKFEWNLEDVGAIKDLCTQMVNLEKELA